MIGPKPLSLSLSKRTLWFIDALVRSGGYGDNRNDVIRRFVFDGISKAMDAGDLPKPPVRDPLDIPLVEKTSGRAKGGVAASAKLSKAELPARGRKGAEAMHAKRAANGVTGS